MAQWTWKGLFLISAISTAWALPPDQCWVTEKTNRTRNTSPVVLLENTFQAIEAEDTVSLARTMRSLAGRKRLSEVDVLDAHRQFTWGSALAGWQKLREAFNLRNFQLQEEGQRSEMRLDLGDSLGICELEMVCVDGNWYFADL